LAQIDLDTLAELEWRESSVGSIPCRIVRRSPSGSAGAEFACEQSQLARLWDILCDAAKSASGGPAGYSALNAIRLESGIPWFGYDFGEKQIPHEAGLENSHISYTKGCYTGQEIVERVRSRGQVNRVRALLQLSSRDVPKPETPIVFDGKEVGYVTRAAQSPAFQSVIAMGYVRREQSLPGTTVQIGGKDAAIVAAR